MKYKFIILLFWLIGLGSTLNGLWMLIAPELWFHKIPADVHHFGPYNVHFVRDVGCAYLTVGLGLVLAAWRPRMRAAMALLAALFYGLHALVHVYDTARGHVRRTPLVA